MQYEHYEKCNSDFFAVNHIGIVYVGEATRVGSEIGSIFMEELTLHVDLNLNFDANCWSYILLALWR